MVVEDLVIQYTEEGRSLLMHVHAVLRSVTLDGDVPTAPGPIAQLIGTLIISAVCLGILALWFWKNTLRERRERREHARKLCLELFVEITKLRHVLHQTLGVSPSLTADEIETYKFLMDGFDTCLFPLFGDDEDFDDWVALLPDLRKEHDRWKRLCDSASRIPVSPLPVP